MKKQFLILMIAASILYSCREKLDIGKNISNSNYTFLNQDSVDVKLDSIIQNKITLIGYIYTHCPDICPMTTHNLYITEQKLNDEKINNVQFVLISFDPERDTPSVLKDFARVRDLDLNKWVLLTGENNSVKRFNSTMGVKAIPADSTYTEEGILNYYIIHTDRITLIDRQGRVRAEYKGSTVDPQIIFDDVKYLGD